MGQKCFFVIPRAGENRKRHRRSSDTQLICGRRNARRLAKQLSREHQSVSEVVAETSHALILIALYNNGKLKQLGK